MKVNKESEKFKEQTRLASMIFDISEEELIRKIEESPDGSFTIPLPNWAKDK